LNRPAGQVNQWQLSRQYILLVAKSASIDDIALDIVLLNGLTDAQAQEGHLDQKILQNHQLAHAGVALSLPLGFRL